VHSSQNVTFAGCNFTSLGATALAILDSSQSVVVANSTFRAVSCSGVAVGQVSDINTTGTVNGFFAVQGNLFEGVPGEFHDCAPILGGYVVGTNISNNAVLNASNGGICVGWGWSRDEARNSGWNRIERNYVMRSNWLLEDCGSIYVLGPQPNSVMAENFLAHQGKLYGALYTDEGSAWWHMTHNVVHDVPEWLHIWTPSIVRALCAARARTHNNNNASPHTYTAQAQHDELVDFNWSDQTYQDVHGTRCVVVNNTFIPPGTPLGQWPAEAQAVMAASGPAWWGGARV
jgi:hypothetical protein